MVEYLTYFMAWFTFVLVTIGFYIARKHYLITMRIFEKHQKWLFDSLYSLNSNVKLPDEMEKKEYKKAIIVSDKDDPMKEFSGDHDDYFK